MKKTLIILAYCIIAFLSCSKTDNRIVGIWQRINAPEEVTSYLNMGAVDVIQINDDGGFKKTTTMLFNDSKSTGTESGNWKIEGDSIFLIVTSTENGKPFVYHYFIKELSDNKLVFSATNEVKEIKWEYERIK